MPIADMREIPTHQCAFHFFPSCSIILEVDTPSISNRVLMRVRFRIALYVHPSLSVRIRLSNQSMSCLLCTGY